MESDEVLQSLVTPNGFVDDSSTSKIYPANIDSPQPSRDLVGVVGSFLDILEGCLAYFWEKNVGRYSILLLFSKLSASSHIVLISVLVRFADQSRILMT
jgi:hypothetical protein